MEADDATTRRVEDPSPRAAASAAMERYARGDDAAFSLLYDLLADRLFGFLLRQTRSRAAAEDLVQQTFLQMHLARATYLPGADVLTWAFAIGRRLGIDRYRRTRHEVVGDADEAAGAPRVSGIVGPEDALHAKQIARRLQHAVDGLPEPQREAFVLLKLEGLSLADAAEVLGCTITAVKLRAHRAYEALRASVDEGDLA